LGCRVKPLVYWARAEKWRIRPTHKTDAEIRGTLLDPEGQPHPFCYDRHCLILEIKNGAKAGRWQLDEWGVPTPLDEARRGGRD